MKNMTIGSLSKGSGVKVTTIRYYESIGLMGEPERSASGRRLYRACDVERLTFIRHSRHLGFPVEAIRELIELQANPDGDCEKANITARKQLDLVRERIAQLRALESELERISTACEGGQVADCRVMAAINDHSQCASERHELVKGF